MASLAAVLGMVVLGAIGGSYTADALTAGSVPIAVFRLAGTIVLCSGIVVTVIRAERTDGQ